jgi:transposase InsO family protein
MGMNWNQTNTKQEREAFIGDFHREKSEVAELARRYGISRKTAYKWLGRFAEKGWAGLEERSRAPQNHPNALSAEIEERVLELKARWPKWGAPKLLVKLREHVPVEDCPSESSVSRILQRHGLVRPQGRRRPRAQGTPLQDYVGSNAIWCADFKGWFSTGDGTICTPLTMTDGFSRYLLRCQGLSAGTGGWIVKPIFETVLREYGLPEAIRTDNGAPFACAGLGGLTKLSVWWLRLGIRLERSRPGCPQDNGRHERMHRTLKAETAQPPRANMAAQQRAFDAFRREYNQERPHEGIDGQTPAAIYVPSTREFPVRLPEVEYAAHWSTRQVRESGQIKWRGKNVHVTMALAGERIGLEPLEDGLWMTHFATHPLGVFDERRGTIEPLRGRRKERRS